MTKQPSSVSFAEAGLVAAADDELAMLSSAARSLFVADDTLAAAWVNFAAARWSSAARSYLLQDDKPEVQQAGVELDAAVGSDRVRA